VLGKTRTPKPESRVPEWQVLGTKGRGGRDILSHKGSRLGPSLVPFSGGTTYHGIPVPGRTRP
jgi:hypothetical protein